jgi:hypothetical protein
MAWNPSPKIADCRDVARKWDADMVVVLAINTQTARVEVNSYGATRGLCDAAGSVGKKIMQQIQDGTLEP